MSKERGLKGEGSAYKVSENKWRAKITIGKKLNGKPDVKYFSGESEREVRKKLNDYKKELIKNDYRVVKKMTLEDYITNWLTEYKALSIKPSSYDRLERTIQNHIVPELGMYQFGSIQPGDIQSLINDKARMYSAPTVKKIYEALNACFNHAIDNDTIIKNPMRTVELPSKDNYAVKEKDIRILSNDEIKRFVVEAKRQYSTGKFAHINGFALILMLNTGLRAGELLGLEVDAIDLSKKSMVVNQNIALVKDRSENDEKYKLVTQSVKTKSGNRVVPLNSTAIEMVNFLIKQYAIYRKDKNYLVVSKDGNPIRHRNLQKTLDAILKKADIKHCGLHTMRHSYVKL